MFEMMMNSDWFIVCCLQREGSESGVVYNTLGSNICMGDHKVIRSLKHPIQIQMFQRMLMDESITQMTILLVMFYVFSPACFPVFSTEDNCTLTLGESKGEDFQGFFLAIYFYNMDWYWYNVIKLYWHLIQLYFLYIIS